MGTGAGIEARTRFGPGVGLQDRAGEVLPELKLPTEPGSLASSSSTESIGGVFRQGERRGRDFLGAISVDTLGLVSKFSSERAGLPVGYGAFGIVM